MGRKIKKVIIFFLLQSRFSFTGNSRRFFTRSDSIFPNTG
mgnify:CR=1 FL=1